MIFTCQEKRGFTLIELLVVISIIALLSSLVLAGLAEARNKARLARALVFEHNTHSALFNSLVGEWTFDELSAGTLNANTTIIDTSGGKSGGSIANDTSIPTVVEGVNGGKALYFSNGLTYINVPDKPIFRLNEGTISAWIKTIATDSGAAIVSKDQTYTFYQRNDPSNTPYLSTYSWASGNGVSFGVQPSGVKINDGEWHHVTLSFKHGEAGGTTFYIDGVEAASVGIIGTPSVTTVLEIGRGWWDGATLDNIRIYSQRIQQ